MEQMSGLLSLPSSIQLPGGRRYVGAENQPLVGYDPRRHVGSVATAECVVDVPSGVVTEVETETTQRFRIHELSRLRRLFADRGYRPDGDGEVHGTC